MQTKILRNRNDLKELEVPMRDLEPPTPFHGWGFLEAWMEQRSSTKTPFVVLVSDQGQWVAIALWCVERTKLGIRRLTGMGGNDAWYHDPWVFQESQADRIAQALVSALQEARSQWDMLQLALRPDESTGLRQELRRLGVAFTDHADWRQQQTARLGEDWRRFWEDRPKQLRELVRRRGKKLAVLNHRFLEADSSNFERLLEGLFRLHKDRWSDERDWTDYYRLIRGVTVEALNQGRLAFFALEVDDHPVALELLIRCGDRSYELMRVTDPSPEFSPLSAGSLLTAWAFEQMHGQGVRTVDMGPGHFEWKASLETERTQAELHVVAPATRPIALAFAGWLGGAKPFLRSVPQIRQLKSAINRMTLPSIPRNTIVNRPA